MAENLQIKQRADGIIVLELGDVSPQTIRHWYETLYELHTTSLDRDFHLLVLHDMRHVAWPTTTLVENMVSALRDLPNKTGFSAALLVSPFLLGLTQITVKRLPRSMQAHIRICLTFDEAVAWLQEATTEKVAL